MEKQNKIFAIISLGFLGDTILTEPIYKNLRKKYNDCKIITITNKLFEEVPLGFEDNDEIFAYDKNNIHKGLKGYYKFRKEFKYTNKIDYAIITHPHERSVILAKFIGAKNIISLDKCGIFNFFINKKIKYIEDEIRKTYKAEYNLNYLKHICDEIKYKEVTYKRNDINYSLIKNKFSLPEKYIVLAPTSKDLIKDWDYQNIKEFITKIPSKVVLVGTEKAEKIAKELEKESVKFINLCNKTTISELGAIIHEAEYCISVDSGPFHFAYSQGIKTIGLFFNKDFEKEWAPKNLAYVKTLIGEKLEEGKEIKYVKNISAKDVIIEIESMELCAK